MRMSPCRTRSATRATSQSCSRSDAADRHTRGRPSCSPGCFCRGCRGGRLLVLVRASRPARQQPMPDAPFQLLPESCDAPFSMRNASRARLRARARAVIAEQQHDLAGRAPPPRPARRRRRAARRAGSPPDPILPPTATLKPLTSSPSTILIAGVSARSCDSACVQCSVQPLMPTLNFRGRFVNALLPTNVVGELAHDRRRVEQLVGRQAGDRTADDVADVVHAGLERQQADRARAGCQISGTCSIAEAADLNLLPGRDVDEAACRTPRRSVGDRSAPDRRW